MINARHRLHGHNSLKKVYAAGETVRGTHISLKFAGRNNRRGYRAAVVVSRKVHKSAIVRNRIRRRVYEIIRQADAELVTGKDLVFTVFSEQVATVPAPKLRATVESLLRKAASQPTVRRQTSVRHAIVDKTNPRAKGN